MGAEPFARGVVIVGFCRTSAPLAWRDHAGALHHRPACRVRMLWRLSITRVCMPRWTEVRRCARAPYSRRRLRERGTPRRLCPHLGRGVCA